MATPEAGKEYWLQQGESTDAYNTRIGEYRASLKGGVSGSDKSLSSPTSSDMFADFTSSFAPRESTIMDAYKSSRKNLNQASQAGQELIKSEYGTAEEDTIRSGELKLTDTQEQQSGFARSPLALSLIGEATDKRVRELKKEKNELLLQNEYEKASALSQSIVDEQTALTQARVNALNEFFGFRQEERATATADREERSFRTPEQTVALNLASQFPDAGIIPGDDFATAQQKVTNSPSYQQNQDAGDLALQQARANINLTQAQTQEALSGVTGTSGGNSITFVGTDGQTKTASVSPLTKAVMDGTGSIKDLTPTDKAGVLAEMSNIGYNPKQNLVERMKSIIDLWKKIPEQYKGPLQGRLYGIGGYGANINPQIATFESARIPLTREIARLYDVGMLSDQDVADYKSAMPSLGDNSAEAAQAKIDGLTTAMIPPPPQSGPQSRSMAEQLTDRTSSGMGYTIIP